MEQCCVSTIYLLLPSNYFAFATAGPYRHQCPTLLLLLMHNNDNCCQIIKCFHKYI